MKTIYVIKQFNDKHSDWAPPIAVDDRQLARQLAKNKFTEQGDSDFSESIKEYPFYTAEEIELYPIYVTYFINNLKDMTHVYQYLTKEKYDQKPEFWITDWGTVYSKDAGVGRREWDNRKLERLLNERDKAQQELDKLAVKVAMLHTNIAEIKRGYQ